MQNISIFGICFEILQILTIYQIGSQNKKLINQNLQKVTDFKN